MLTPTQQYIYNQYQSGNITAEQALAELLETIEQPLPNVHRTIITTDMPTTKRISILHSILSDYWCDCGDNS